jgi:hypothetical protein
MRSALEALVEHDIDRLNVTIARAKERANDVELAA